MTDDAIEILLHARFGNNAEASPQGDQRPRRLHLPAGADGQLILSIEALELGPTPAEIRVVVRFIGFHEEPAERVLRLDRHSTPLVEPMSIVAPIGGIIEVEASCDPVCPAQACFVTVRVKFVRQTIPVRIHAAPNRARASTQVAEALVTSPIAAAPYEPSGLLVRIHQKALGCPR